MENEFYLGENDLLCRPEIISSRLIADPAAKKALTRTAGFAQTRHWLLD